MRDHQLFPPIMPQHWRNSSSTSSNNVHNSKMSVATSAYRPSTPAPLEIVTFQYVDSPVFVKRPETYQEAIDTAKKEYYQLAHLPAHRVGFALNDIAHPGRLVRISEGAWAAISAKIPGGTIVNVLVLPDPDEKSPPQYGLLDVPTPPPKDSSYLGIRKAASSSSIRNGSKPTGGRFAWIGVGK